MEPFLKLPKSKILTFRKGHNVSKIWFSIGGQGKLDTNTPQGTYSLLGGTIEVHTKQHRKKRAAVIGDGETLLLIGRTISTVYWRK